MSDSLDVFQGKWKDLDKSLALQIRDALQKVTDSWEGEGERQCYARTTVLLTIVEEYGTKCSRLSTNHGSTTHIREALEEAVTAEAISGRTAQGRARQVAEIWAGRLTAEYTPVLTRDDRASERR